MRTTFATFATFLAVRVSVYIYYTGIKFNFRHEEKGVIGVIGGTFWWP